MSLFAMLMIFIGPLISQSMPMEHHAGMSMPVSMSMPSGVDMPASMDMAADSHASSHADHHASGADMAGVDHVIWAKCGYCTLLFSCPAIAQTLAVIAPVPPHPADFYSALPQQGHAERTVFPNALSRAPPSAPVV
ncbi:DUF2946 domain-containing protein [Pseudomonas sp. NPDC090202]|uniref:DUF2946 domain-containing protein n=1 Tax=unclassified Pseudomonas TaxID=196821 RepID=UPI00382640DC